MELLVNGKLRRSLNATKAGVRKGVRYTGLLLLLPKGLRKMVNELQGCTDVQKAVAAKALLFGVNFSYNADEKMLRLEDGFCTLGVGCTGKVAWLEMTSPVDDGTTVVIRYTQKELLSLWNVLNTFTDIVPNSQGAAGRIKDMITLNFLAEGERVVNLDEIRQNLRVAGSKPTPTHQPSHQQANRR